MFKRHHRISPFKLAIFILSFHLIGFKAFAESSIGFVLGDPTGLSSRFGLENGYSLSSTLSSNASKNEGLELQLSLLKDKARQFRVEQIDLEFYYGLGFRWINIVDGKDKGKADLALRAPLGLTHNIQNPNLQLFGEISPHLGLTPSTDFDFDIGVGARFLF